MPMIKFFTCLLNLQSVPNIGVLKTQYLKQLIDSQQICFQKNMYLLIRDYINRCTKNITDRFKLHWYSIHFNN